MHELLLILQCALLYFRLQYLVDPSPLIPYVESLGLKYHYIRDDIGKLNKMLQIFFCFHEMED